MPAMSWSRSASSTAVSTTEVRPCPGISPTAPTWTPTACSRSASSPKGSPPDGFEVLDVHEGVAGGHYERRWVGVVRTDTGETVQAIVYVALKTGTGLRPTRAYLGFLLAGRDLLPPDYWERLRATPTLD